MQKNTAAAKHWKHAFVFAPDTLDESVRTRTPEQLKIYESNVSIKVKEYVVSILYFALPISTPLAYVKKTSANSCTISTHITLSKLNHKAGELNDATKMSSSFDAVYAISSQDLLY